MLAAPTLDDVLAHRDRTDGAACCIVIAPLFSEVGREEVVPRIGYLDHRSGERVHFYCAGYGGYWNEPDVPDKQDIGKVKYSNSTMIPWAFSQRLFGAFVDRLEESTTWEYKGNAELILMGPAVDFSKAMILEIGSMVKDGGIDGSAEVFEAIIRYCRTASGKPSAYDFSDLQGMRAVGTGAAESLLALLPAPVRGIWQRGRHYAIRDLRKAG
jgi:hypothetical protein